MFNPISLRLCRAVLAAAGMAAIGVSVTGPLLAQSPPLGDVARKEQERRKALPSSAKVYTNKDLPKGATRPAEGTGQAADAAGAMSAEGQGAPGEQPEATPAASSAPKPAANDPAKDAGNQEAAWRKRITDAREEVRRNEMFAEALQTRINSLGRDALSRDDYAQKARITAERKEAVAELARVKQAIEGGRKQIADIEEEARKAGVPPGWLR